MTLPGDAWLSLRLLTYSSTLAGGPQAIVTQRTVRHETIFRVARSRTGGIIYDKKKTLQMSTPILNNLAEKLRN